MMREIELWTADDRFVAVVDIPAFRDVAMPEVVVWGERVFKRAVVVAPERSLHQEVFAVVSLTPSPGRPRRPA